MIISWKTDGSAGAVDTMQDRLANGTNSNYYEDKYGLSYEEWATNNGRVNYKAELVDGDLIITEEWNISREEYDAFVSGGQIDHTPGGISLPVVETTDHLTF